MKAPLTNKKELWIVNIKKNLNLNIPAESRTHNSQSVQNKKNTLFSVDSESYVSDWTVFESVLNWRWIASGAYSNVADIMSKIVLRI